MLLGMLWSISMVTTSYCTNYQLAKNRKQESSLWPDRSFIAPSATVFACCITWNTVTVPWGRWTVSGSFIRSYANTSLTILKNGSITGGLCCKNYEMKVKTRLNGFTTEEVELMKDIQAHRNEKKDLIARYLENSGSDYIDLSKRAFDVNSRLGQPPLHKKAIDGSWFLSKPKRMALSP